MGRVAVIKIVGGDFERGFPVWLQVCQDGAGLPETTIKGQLPSQILLEGLYISWLVNFRGLRNQRTIDWCIEDLQTNVGIDEDVKACREIVEQLEKNFQKWLQNSADEGWQKIRERLVEELAKNPDSLRITIQAEDTRLWKMPWHAWDVLSRYPEVGIGFSLPEFDPSPNQKPVGSRVRVLAILGNSDNIDLTADRLALEALDADVVVLQEPAAAEVMQHLRDEQGWDIFCFAGHSETRSDTGKIYINKTESLKIGEFKNALAEAIACGLKLAIFNSCDGLGLARDMASLQLPVAIVMKEPVPDIVAQSFLREFLKEYAGGKSLYASVRRAGERLEEFKDLPGCTWLPIVCQNPAEVPPSWADLRGELTSQRKRYRNTIVVREEERSQPTPVRPRIGQRQRFLTMAIAAFLVVGLQSLGILQPLELKAFDHLMQKLPEEPADKKLLIVAADEADIAEYGFPLPDAVLVRMLDKLQEHNPSAIGLNIIRDIPNNKGGMKSYQKLIARLQQNKNLISVCSIGQSFESSIAPPALSPKQQVGFFELQQDLPNNKDDDTIRRYVLSRTLNPNDEKSLCHSLHSLAFLLAYKYLSARQIKVETVKDSWKFGSIVVPPLERDSGGYHNLDARGNQLLIRYRHTSKLEDIAQTASITDVLTDKSGFNPAWVKDRVVLIGVTAKTAFPYYHYTPYGKTSLLHIQAHAVSQILSAVEDGRPLLWWWPQWADNLWVGFWLLVGAAIVWQSQRPLHQWLGMLISITILYGCCWFTLTKAGWIPLIPAGLALVSTSAAKALYDMLKNAPSRPT